MRPAATAPVRARRGWLSLGAALALILVLVAADAALKRAPHAGFVLPGADVTLATDNLPAAWAALEDSPTFGRIREKAPQLYQQFGLASRLRTGIRWTPLRWYVWFGRPACVSISDGDWAISCRPGLLLRGAHALGLLDAAAWRDGYLLLGSARPIADALARDGVSVPNPPKTIAVAWRGRLEGEAELHLAGNWSVRGVVQLQDLEGGGRADLRRADVWPGSPAATLFVSRTEIIDQLLPDDWPDFPFGAELERAWEDFRAKLPRNWDASAESYQFALASVDTRGTVPVPDLSVVLRPQAPFPALDKPASAIPYVWGVTPGWMEPWLGEPMSFYAASDRRIRVFANQEPTMSRLLNESLAGRNVPYDARLQADFVQLAAVARALARTAAREQLLPAYSVQDVEREIIPYIAAVGELGRLTLEGRVVGEQLVFAGSFEPPADVDDENET